jgi:hypothetical protein
MCNTFNIHTFDWDMVSINGYYRYVNHKLGLLSVGFPRAETWTSYEECLRDDEDSRRAMSQRYEECYK